MSLLNNKLKIQKGTDPIADLISKVFESGMYKPAAILLASCLICTFFIGWPMVLGWIIVVFAIFVVALMIP
jgi:hypothetical protein